MLLKFAAMVKIIIVFFSLSFCCNLHAQDVINRELLKKIDIKIDSTIQNKYACSVLIALNDQVMFHKGYGFVDTIKQQPTSSKTLFNIASITKTFTAVGILRLMDKGMLQLSDSIGKFFSNVPQDKKEITIHHLLTHTSGFQQNYVASLVSNRDSAVRRYLNDTLGFVPGSNFGYSNQNMEMLAAIIEVITKEKYEDFIREEILTPCGMQNTYFWEEAGTLKPGVVASPQLKVNRDWDYIGSGGIYTTPSDLFKFYLAVKNNKLLKPQTTALQFRTYKELGATNIGYGWFINKGANKVTEYWTRGSESWGHNAVLRWFPDANIVVIVFSSSGEMDNDPGKTANRFISDMILKQLAGNK